MADFIHYFLAPLDPFNSGPALGSVWGILTSTPFALWFFLLPLIRFALPPFVLWLVWIVRPQSLEVPKGWPAGEALPLVSVVIAGRNPGPAVRRTIASVLNNGYPNVEVVYADDFSTDDSVAQARTFEGNGRVRVFAVHHHSGKPSCLNVACRMARGTYIFIVDADSNVEYGAIETLLHGFADPKVGAVCSNIGIRNARLNLLTSLVELDYALSGTIGRLWRTKLGLLSILPGAAAMFRADAMAGVGYYDTGLGDDTDMTVRIRKAGWRISLAKDAWVWTDSPETWKHLVNQRVRWARNMVKVRFRKQIDLASFRFGFSNAFILFDVMLFRVVFPVWAFVMIGYALVRHPADRPIIFTSMFWVATILVALKLLIANDLAGTPRLKNIPLAFIFPLYRLPLRFYETVAIVRELLRIKLWHPYVPKHIWRQTPHH